LAVSRGRHFGGGLLAAGAATLLAALAPAGALAADPSCGDSITHDVTLHHDLDCTSGGSDGLDVGKAGLTIDLNGHSIIGAGGTDGKYGIYDNGKDRVTIKNGTLKNWETGIYFDAPVARATVENVTIKLDGNQQWYGLYSDYGTGGHFTNVKVDNANEGVYLYEGSANTLDHLKVTRSGYGTYIDYEVGDLIKDSSANNGGTNTYGMYEEYGHNRYVNDAANKDYNGFYIDYPYGTSLTKSTANDNEYVGFYFPNVDPAGGYSASVSNSTANHNEYGFYADEQGVRSSGNTAIDNDYPCYWVSCGG
jgi:copper-binding protein NosD